MILVYKGSQLQINWTIYKGMSKSKEDFRRALLRVFLVRTDMVEQPPLDDMYPVFNQTEYADYVLHPSAEVYADTLPMNIVSVENGTIKIDIPQSVMAQLPVGVYSLKAVWFKNKQLLHDATHVGVADKSYSIVQNKFAITDVPAESTNPEIDDPVLNVQSSIATYGYNGLDSYEEAVLNGETLLSRGLWIANLSEMNSRFNEIQLEWDNDDEEEPGLKQRVEAKITDVEARMVNVENQWDNVKDEVNEKMGEWSEAETQRESNETTRISNETTRQSNETTRQGNETARQSNEATRLSQESGRVSAESTRASNETTRISNESARQSQESTRQSNETTRQNQESEREIQAARDHSQASSDHSTAVSDHTTAQSDHTTAASDHTTAQSDHDSAVQSTAIQYAEGDDDTTAPSTGWQNTVPEVEAGKYLWSRTTFTYGDGTTKVVYSVSLMPTVTVTENANGGVDINLSGQALENGNVAKQSDVSQLSLKVSLYNLDQLAPLTNNEHYSINGTGQSYKVTISHGADADGDITLTIDSTDHTIAVTADDTAEEVATKIAATTITGWTLKAEGANVIMAKTTIGLSPSTITFADTDTTGVTASVSLNSAGSQSAMSVISTVIPADERIPGRHIAFTNVFGKLEQWQYTGDTINSVGSWTEDGSKKLSELTSKTTDIDNSIYGGNIITGNGYVKYDGSLIITSGLWKYAIVKLADVYSENIYLSTECRNQAAQQIASYACYDVNNNVLTEGIGTNVTRLINKNNLPSSTHYIILSFFNVVEVFIDNYAISNTLQQSVAKLNNAISSRPLVSGTGVNSLALPNGTASGNYSTAIGYMNEATSAFSTAEGIRTKASGEASHSEGYGTTSSGAYSHSEGNTSHAEGNASHAEGYASHSEGNSSHAEGNSSHAEGNSSHAEGHASHAEGYASHAEGYASTAINSYEHACGYYNVSNKVSDEFGNSGNTIFSVGINYKNAFEIMQSGGVYMYGVGGYDGTNPTEANTVGYEIKLSSNHFKNKVLSVDMDDSIVGLYAPMPSIGNTANQEIVTTVSQYVAITKPIKLLKYDTFTYKCASNQNWCVLVKSNEEGSNIKNVTGTSSEDSGQVIERTFTADEDCYVRITFNPTLEHSASITRRIYNDEVNSIFVRAFDTNKNWNNDYNIVPDISQSVPLVVYEADTDVSSNHIVNAVVYPNGEIIACRCGGSVVHIDNDGTETILLSIPNATDWRCLFMDSHLNVYASPHDTRTNPSVHMDMNYNGLYKFPYGDIQNPVKVIALYDPDAPADTHANEENNDTIWTMCEDNNGILYAGVYAHSVHVNPAIYRSTDGGEQWEYIHNFIDDHSLSSPDSRGRGIPKHVHSLICNHYNNKLYAIVGEVNTILESSDKAETWTDLDARCFPTKGTALIEVPDGLIVGSDFSHECALTKVYTNNKTRTTGVFWSSTIFALRRSDITGFIYAFAVIDDEVNVLSSYPPVDAVNNESVLDTWKEEHPNAAKWYRYNEWCSTYYPSESIRPHSAAILRTQDFGESWEIVYKHEVGYNGPFGFATVGYFRNGECLAGVCGSTSNGYGFINPIVISEGHHKYGAEGIDVSDDILGKIK